MLGLAWFAPGRNLRFCGFQWARYAWTGGDGPGVVIATSRGLALVAVAAALSLTLSLAGRTVTRLARFRPAGAAEAFTVPFLCGIGLTGTAWFGAGLAGLFMPGVLLAMAVLPAIVEIRREAAGRPATHSTPVVVRPPWWAAATAAFLLLQAAPYWLCPETDQDALDFHLALPERFLSLHRIQLDPLEASAYAFRPMPFDLLHAPAIALDADPVARLLQAAGLLAGLWLVGAFVARRSGTSVAWMAALVAAGALTVAHTAARAKNDLAAAATVTAAWLIWLERRSPARGLVAACLGGFAVAIKPTTAPVAAVLILTIIPSRAARLRGAVFAAGIAGFALLPFAPWLLRTWLITGDPAYPHLSPRWFTGLHWSAGSATIWHVLESYQSFRAIEPSLPGAAWRWLCLDAPGLLVLLPLAFASSRRPAWRTVAALGLAVVLTLAGQPAARYLIPAGWVLVAVVTPAVAALPGRAGRVALAGALFAACLPHLLVFPAEGLAADDRARFGNPWPYVAGARSRDAFLRTRLTTLQELRDAVAGSVRPGDRVLMHHDARGYRLGRMAQRGQEDADEPVLWLWAKEGRTPADLAKRFRQRRIAALTATPSRYFRYDAAAHEFAWDARMLKLMRGFSGRRLAVVWRSDTEDQINGDALLFTVAERDRAGGGPWPMLPATGSAWSHVAYRMQAAALAAGGLPPRIPEVERELLLIRGLLPGVGESALRLGHYHLVTGDPDGAARWYRTALAEGFESCQLLARLATALPDGLDRDEVISRGRRRCGAAFTAQLDAEARWRPRAGTMAR